jgi:hypothetical protein
MRALGAVVVGAKVDSLAAEGAAVIDEFLVLLDGHVDWCAGGWKKVEANIAGVELFSRSSDAMETEAPVGLELRRRCWGWRLI